MNPIADAHNDTLKRGGTRGMHRRSFLKNTFAGIGGALTGSHLSMAIQPEGPRPPAPDHNDEVPGWGYSRWPATGPLRANPANPRYFTDGSGRAIFLTGSHTWANFQDLGLPPVARFDYPAYIDMMVKHNHNFMRFWHWMQAAYRALDGREDSVRTVALPAHRAGRSAGWAAQVRPDEIQS